MELLLELKEQGRLTVGLLHDMWDRNCESRRLAQAYLVDVVCGRQDREVYERAVQTLVELERVRTFLEGELGHGR